MDTRLLEYFVTVAAEESITETAHVLDVAQSTVSVGLRSLERELGVTLFDRSTRSVRISEAGEQLLPQARVALDAVEEIRTRAGQNAAGERGRLRVGIFTAMEQLNRLPEALSDFRALHPGIDVTLGASRSGSTGLSEDLLRGRIDLAFVALDNGNDFETVELSSAPYVALLPSSHPLAHTRSVSLAQLADDNWVDVMEGYGNRLEVERALRERGLTRHIIAEVNAVPAIPLFVAAGLGVSVVPLVVEAKGCAVVPLSDSLPRWRLSLAMRTENASRVPIRAFVEIVTKHFRLMN